jgi:16S rRNA (cytosine1402-N4)-methyltransferase
MTDQAQYSHMPVLLEKSLELLEVRPGFTWVDATAGGGGHLSAIAQAAGTSARVIGIDRDSSSIKKLQSKVPETVQLVHSNYSSIKKILHDLDCDTVNGGILADLGVSSMQIDDPQRGFSFMNDGPLDMRMDPTAALDAEQLINTLGEKQLADLIYEFGEERQSRRIARKIVESRPLKSTAELCRIVSQCVKRASHKDACHPATRTFQALRMAVNDELGSLEKFLRDSIAILAPGARLAVITFHSLEDRLVKQIFREAACACICPPRQPVCTCQKNAELLIITRKPIVAEQKEVLANPRSRSAKLRVGQKLP